MELTPLQLQHYESFGFLIIRDFLAQEVVQELRDTLDALKTAESGETDTLKHSGRVLGMFHTDALHRRLFDDPRLYAIAGQLLGGADRVRFLGDEYASFSTPADWHPDMGSDVQFESLKFGFYLDDITRGGFLRVVPGSHHPTFSNAVTDYRSQQEPPAEIDGAHPCMTSPGDLLIFNLRLWHQGTANPPGTHRRVIFWSVGQNSPGFNTFARNFHNREGRGEAHESWPAAMLADAPPHRLAMLRVYEPDAVKQLALS